MNRYIIGSLWDRANRNGANKNFEYLFQGRRKIDELNVKADGVLNEAKKTNDMNEDVRKRIDNLILESGNSDAEIVDARVDVQGENHMTLKNRLDKSQINLEDTQQSLSFSEMKNVEIESYSSTEPMFLDSIGDGFVYGSRSRSLFRKKNVEDNWELIANIPADDAITGLKIVGDGEVLVACSTAGIWKSTGWKNDPKNSTFKRVLATNGPVQQFSWDTDPGSKWVTVTNYISAGNMSNSRYVWLSKDNGNTFDVIFDSATAETEMNNYHSHFHVAILDPYHNTVVPRIWISYHKTNADPTEMQEPVKRIKYTDDGGISWVDFSNEKYQPEAAIATPEGIYFASDEDVVGVYFVERQSQRSKMKYELIYTMRSSYEGLYGLGTKLIRDGSVTHIAFRSTVANHPAYVVSAQGRNIAETLRLNPATTNDSVDLVNIVVHGDKFLATFYNTVSGSGPMKLIADKPSRGVSPYPPNIGALEGGHARGGGVSGGYDSYADLRATSVGHEAQSKRDGVALGHRASAEIEGTATGMESNVSTNGVANGYKANTDEGVAVGRFSEGSGNGTAIGGRAKSINGSTAIGYFSEASGVRSVAYGMSASSSGDSSVSLGAQSKADKVATIAIGEQAQALHNISVALGYQTKTTAVNQLNIGQAHIEIKNTSTPTVPPSGGIRLASRIVDGKTQAYIQLPNGESVIIAQES